MPLKTALRKTRLRPMAASSPGGQTAKISHSSTATAMRAISAHAGWRSMNLLTTAARRRCRRGGRPPGLLDAWDGLPSTCILPRAATFFGIAFLGILTGGKAADLIESIFYRSARRPSGTQRLGRTAVIGRRHPDRGGEEAGEPALRREAEVKADIGDRHFRGDQRIERLLHN